MKSLMSKIWKEEEGATMIEYALLAALIGVVLIAVIGALTNSLSNTFNTVKSSLDNAAGAGGGS